MKLPEELKNAISHLSSKEKDTLIFRLLKKDVKLANQLLFEFVSNDTIEHRREQTKEALIRQINYATREWFSVGILHMYMRDMNGIINEHVSITKDKYGEITLSLFAITELIKKNRNTISKEAERKAHKFCVAVIARAFKILILIQKLHKDYLMDFENDLTQLGELIAENSHLTHAATFHRFDVQWLLDGDIPEDIEQIHKDIRANGLLR